MGEGKELGHRERASFEERKGPFLLLTGRRTRSVKKYYCGRGEGLGKV